MDDDTEDVRARWRESAARAASRAYESAHGSPIPSEQRGVRWQLSAKAATSLAVVVMILGGVVWAGLREAPTQALAGTALPGATGAPTPLAGIRVHLAGAVESPGVVSLALGSRVEDAVEAAGGARADADLDAVNLARPVADGEQIYLPTIGEQPGGTGAGADGLININRGTQAELESLPGVGPVLAQRIIDDREANGPFLTVDDLTRVQGVGDKLLDGLRDAATA